MPIYEVHQPNKDPANKALKYIQLKTGGQVIGNTISTKKELNLSEVHSELDFIGIKSMVFKIG